MCGKIHESPINETYGSNEIKLHWEIDISGVDGSMLKEYSGESNALVKNIKVNANPACSQYDVEVEDSSNKMEHGKVGEATEPNKEIGLDTDTESVNGNLDLDTVQKIFLKEMNSFDTTDIVETFPCPSTMVQDRLELFEKQAKIIKKYHGDANFQFAWLPLSKEELSTMFKYGLGHCRLSANKSTYGIGIHPGAAAYTRLSFFSLHTPIRNMFGVRQIIMITLFET